MNVVDITSAQRIDYGLTLKEEEEKENEKKKSREESLGNVGTLKDSKDSMCSGRSLERALCLFGRLKPRSSLSMGLCRSCCCEAKTGTGATAG
jgi:hypothetical protein